MAAAPAAAGHASPLHALLRGDRGAASGRALEGVSACLALEGVCALLGCARDLRHAGSARCLFHAPPRWRDAGAARRTLARALAEPSAGKAQNLCVSLQRVVEMNLSPLQTQRAADGDGGDGGGGGGGGASPTTQATSYRVTDVWIDFLCVNARLLKSLDLSGCTRVSHRGVMRLAARFSDHLTALDLSRCDKVHAAGVLALAKACPRLRSLGLAHNASCNNDETILQLAPLLPQLTSLNLGTKDEEGNTKFDYMPWKQWVALSRLPPVILGVSDVSLAALANACPRLTSLNVESCSRVTDAGVAALARGCRSLRNVSLVRCRVTNAGVAALGQSCPHLTSVQLETWHATEERRMPGARGHTLVDTVVPLAEGCPRLTTLGLLGSRIGDDSLLALGAAGRCPLLSKIDLRRCQCITPTGMCALARGCPRLVDVHYADSRWYHEASAWRDFASFESVVVALGRHCPRLASLSCWTLTEAGALSLGAGCPALSQLVTVRRANQLTDQGVRALAAGCPLLDALDVSGCEQVTDAGLVALAQGCSSGLLRVDCSGCVQVTDVGVCALAERCSKLGVVVVGRRPRGRNGSRVYIPSCGMYLPDIPTPPLLTTECIDRLKSDAYPRLLVRGFRPPAADQDQEAVSSMFGDNADY